MTIHHKKPDKKNQRRLKKRYIVGFVLILCLVFIFSTFFQPAKWWRFSPSEQISQQPVAYKNLLFTTTNYGTVYAVNRQTGKIEWQYQREKEVIIGPKLLHGQLFIGYNDGVIVSLQASSGNQLWLYQNPGHDLIQTDILLNQTKLFFGDTSGTIRALSQRTGKEVWQVKTPVPESIDKLLTKDGLIWFGSLMFDRGYLYAAKTQGYVVAIHADSGKEIWHKDLEATMIADPYLTRDSLTVSTTTQPVVVLSRSSGVAKQLEEINPEFSAVYCQGDYLPRGALRELAHKSGLQFPAQMFIQESEKNQEVIQVTKNGMTVGYNSNTLKKNWAMQLPFNPKKCFFDYDQSLYVSSEDGQLLKVDLKNRSIAWQKQISEKLLFISSIKKYQSVHQNGEQVYYNTEFLFTSDDAGKIYRINPSTGQINWEFQTEGEVYVYPILVRDSLLVISTNGGLYRLNPNNGKPRSTPLIKPKISWKESIRDVQEGQVYELTFSSANNHFVNPYNEVVLTAEFKDETGKSIQVDGFYYDQNDWKIRFNPPTTGRWSWSAKWKDDYQEKQFQGSFQSSRTFNYLHPATDNQRWLTRDDKKISTFVGFNDCITDGNHNGYPLDDFSISEGGIKTATLSGTVPQTLSFNTSVITLEDYLENYRGGVNLFRQNVSNCSPSLFFPTKFLYSKYLVQEGKIHDQLSQNLFERGYTVWFTLFGFSLPFEGQVRYPNEKIALENYVKYVVARYGAYVDIWEISNEAVVSDEYARRVAQLINKYDPYDRLISISWEKPDMEEITLIAPHWYETEADSESDVATIAQIDQWKSYEKPIIFGEQGNKISNWDETSAQRMRVRVWTAFFHQTFLVFWNQTNIKDFHNPTLANSNLYFADEEKSYTEAFLRLTKDLPVDLKPVTASIYLPGLRSYKIENKDLSLEYFFNAGSNEGLTPVTIANTLQTEATAQWIKPETGEVLKTEQLSNGAFTTSPLFKTDMLLRIDKK